MDGSVGLKGRLTVKVIRARASRWQRLKDLLAGMFRRNL